MWIVRLSFAYTGNRGPEASVLNILFRPSVDFKEGAIMKTLKAVKFLIVGPIILGFLVIIN